MTKENNDTESIEAIRTGKKITVTVNGGTFPVDSVEMDFDASENGDAKNLALHEGESGWQSGFDEPDGSGNHPDTKALNDQAKCDVCGEEFDHVIGNGYRNSWPVGDEKVTVCTDERPVMFVHLDDEEDNEGPDADRTPEERLAKGYGMDVSGKNLTTAQIRERFRERTKEAFDKGQEDTGSSQ